MQLICSSNHHRVRLASLCCTQLIETLLQKSLAGTFASAAAALSLYGISLQLDSHVHCQSELHGFMYDKFLLRSEPQALAYHS